MSSWILRRPRVTRAVGLTVAAALTATFGAQANPEAAQATQIQQAPATRPDPAVTARPLAAPAQARAVAAKSWVPSSVTWPSPGAHRAAAPGTAPTRVDDVVTAAPRSAHRTRTLTSKVWSRQAASGAGVNGVLVGLSQNGPGVTTALSLDVSSVGRQFGAGWAQRAQLYLLSGCTVTDQSVTGCARRTPLPTRLTAGHVLSTNVALPAARSASPGSMTLVAASAGASGSAGSYTATPLAAASSWSAGNSGGSFGWSHPISLPPAPGDLAPELSISYDSGSLDGRVAATNNQPSVLGDGFDLVAGGYIERRFVACSDDPGGNNGTTKTGDLCWKTDNATISLGARSGPLVKASANSWRMYSDDGSLITRWGTAGTSSEYWTVTTTNGTVYTFGKGTPAVGSAPTNSKWSVPVIGNNSGEPCYVSGNYAGSACDGAWRWNLDSVVDVHGNAITATYAKEEGRYGQNLNTKVVAYDRGGYLTSIAYGLSTPSAATPASATVTLTPAERCFVTNGCATGNLTTATAPNYPDVPFDQACYAALGTVAAPATGGCPAVTAPVFYTRKRLSAITTAVSNGATPATYRTVDTYTFGQQFLDPGDGTPALLWTRTVDHVATASDGTTITAPRITLTPNTPPPTVSTPSATTRPR